MWGRNNNPDEYGGLNKADIAYAVRKFLNDAHDYAEHRRIHGRIKGVMTTFMEYVEELYITHTRVYRALLTPIPRPSKFKLLLKNIYDR
jgi:hypothetical protein